MATEKTFKTENEAHSYRGIHEMNYLCYETKNALQDKLIQKAYLKNKFYKQMDLVFALEI